MPQHHEEDHHEEMVCPVEDVVVGATHSPVSEAPHDHKHQDRSNHGQRDREIILQFEQDAPMR